MSLYECSRCGYLTGNAEMNEEKEINLHLEIEHGVKS